MKPLPVLILLVTCFCFTRIASGDEPSFVPLPRLTTDQAKFLKSLEGKWIPKKVLIGGKIYDGQVALDAVQVKKSTFEFLIPRNDKTQWKCTRIAERDKKIDLVSVGRKDSVRYLMKMDGETMWLVTKANDEYEKDWSTEPTKYNLCIVLEREAE